MVDALSSPAYLIRVSAIQGLGLMGSSDAIPHLIYALRHDVHPAVRWDAAETLGRLGAVEARHALLDASSDDHKRVREAARLALDEIAESD